MKNIILFLLFLCSGGSMFAQTSTKINTEYNAEKQPCEVKNIFQKNGKIFMVVDMYQIVQTEDSPAPDFVNKDKKLRTLEVEPKVKMKIPKANDTECEDKNGAVNVLKNKAKIQKHLPLISVQKGKVMEIDVDCYN